MGYAQPWLTPLAQDKPKASEGSTLNLQTPEWHHSSGAVPHPGSAAPTRSKKLPKTKQLSKTTFNASFGLLQSPPSSVPPH